MARGKALIMEPISFNATFGTDREGQLGTFNITIGKGTTAKEAGAEFAKMGKWLQLIKQDASILLCCGTETPISPNEA